jgi:hypothetical protein
MNTLSSQSFDVLSVLCKVKVQFIAIDKSALLDK